MVNQTSLAADWLSEEAADAVDRKNPDGVVSEQKTTAQQTKTQIHKNQQNNLVELSGSATLRPLVIISIPQIISTAPTLTSTAKRFPFSSLNCRHHRVSLFRAGEKRNSPGHMTYAHMTARLHRLAVKKEGEQKIKLSHSAALQGRFPDLSD